MISTKQIKELLMSLSNFDEVVKIYRPNQGESTIVFKIVIKTGKEYFLRIPKDKNESVKSEVLVHDKLRELKVEVPIVYAHQDFCPTLNNHSFILCSSIPGKSCNSLNKLKYSDKILSKAAKDLSIINSIEGTGFGSIYSAKISKEGKLIAEFSTYKEFITDRITKNIDILSKSCHFTRIEINNIKKILDSRMMKIHFSTISNGYLVHGDYHTNHIFYENNTYSGLIDFGDAKIAPREYDLAYLKIKSRNFFNRFESEYKLIEKNMISKVDFQLLTFLIGIRIISSESRLNKIRTLGNKQLQSFKKELVELSNYLTA